MSLYSTKGVGFDKQESVKCVAVVALSPASGPPTTTSR